MTIRTVLGAALAMMLVVAGHEVRAESWTVVCEENFPPYNFVKDGEKTGLDTEIVRAVLDTIGVQEDLTVYPWSRALGMIDAGTADMIYQVVGSPERFEKYLLVGPLRAGKTVFAVRKDATVTYETLEDLKPYTVGTVRGFQYTPDFDHAEFLNKVQASDNRALIRLLMARRVDVIIGDRSTLLYLATQEGVRPDIRVLPKVYREVPRYVALPKDRTDKAERFRKGLEALKASGRLDEILRRWE